MPKISQYTAVTTPSDSDELVVVQAGVTKKMTLTKLADYVDVGSKPFTTATDPALNTAATTAIVNAYSGTIITTTKAGNSQTLAAPTVVTAGKYFTVVNNDTSTHSIPFVAKSVTFTITPGEGQCFLWDGSAWGPTDLGITEVPVKVTQGGTGTSTLTDHGVLLGSGTDPITALGVMTNGQLVIGSTGNDPVVASITDGEGIDITAGAGTLTIACEDATTANKGVTVYSGTTKALAGTDTASAMTPADVAAANAVLAREPDQGVAMTAAASGSSGIAVADNANINFGTGNFTLVWKGSLPDWTPDRDKTLAYKTTGAGADYNGAILYAAGGGNTGKLMVSLYRDDLSMAFPSTVPHGIVDNTIASCVAVVTRETSLVAGSIAFFVNGVQLGASVALTAATTITLSNTGSLYWQGTPTERTAGTVHHAITFNRALTAAEVLHNYRSGPKLEWYDPTGVSPASQTALTSGTLVVGKEYTIDTFVAGDDFANVGGTNVTGNTFVATGTTPTTWTNSSSLRRTGITWGIMSSGFQPAPGQCFDFSGHGNHAMQPATGSSLTQYKKDFEYRWTNTWTASSAAQYVGGLNKAVLSADHFITDIITQATETTDVENLTLGDGSDADRFVTAFTPSATRTKQTIAAQNDGTNLKLVYTPAAEATMTVETIIRGFIWEP